jgi:hypothetical protein
LQNGVIPRITHAERKSSTGKVGGGGGIRHLPQEGGRFIHRRRVFEKNTPSERKSSTGKVRPSRNRRSKINAIGGNIARS